MTRTVKQITLLYGYDAIMSRRERCKGGEVNQIEHQYVITSAPLAIPVKTRTHFAAFNSGNGVGPSRPHLMEEPDDHATHIPREDTVVWHHSLACGRVLLKDGNVAAGDDEANSKAEAPVGL